MQRYFVDSNQITESHIHILDQDAHHIERVLRMKVGDKLLCCDNDGKTYMCEIEEITNDHVLTHILKWMDETTEMPVQVAIASGLPKGDKLELVIQKGTELGAFSFLPFFASRSVVKWDEKKGRKKTERLQKIAKEAAEQSHRSRIPTILQPLTMKQLLEESEGYTVKLIAFEENAKSGENDRLAKVMKKLTADDRILAVFGPEGGLSEEEVKQLTANGFIACSLGPRILRTETAPLYFLSAVSYHTELMG